MFLKRAAMENEQARERLLRHLCGRLTGLLRQLCGGLNGVLEHNRRVREAQRRAREAPRSWRDQQAQAWFNLNQRYERMLEHDRRVREAQAQRLRREEQAQAGWKLDLF